MTESHAVEQSDLYINTIPIPDPNTYVTIPHL